MKKFLPRHAVFSVLAIFAAVSFAFSQVQSDDKESHRVDTGKDGKASKSLTTNKSHLGTSSRLDAGDAKVHKPDRVDTHKTRTVRNEKKHKIHGEVVTTGKAGKEKNRNRSNGQTPSPTVAPAAAILSDARAKTNISFVGWSPMGIPIYRFSYKSEPSKRYQGTIAQAVRAVRPDAVISKDGILYVDYSRLDVRVEELPQ